MNRYIIHIGTFEKCRDFEVTKKSIIEQFKEQKLDVLVFVEEPFDHTVHFEVLPI